MIILMDYEGNFMNIIAMELNSIRNPLYLVIEIAISLLLKEALMSLPDREKTMLMATRQDALSLRSPTKSFPILCIGRVDIWRCP